MLRLASSRLILICSVALIPPATARAQSAPAAVLASADEAWSAGRFNDAFSRYSQVLQQDSTSARALFRVATMLGWRRDLDRSISLFRQYIRLAPHDDNGRLGLARSLAWSGRYSESLAVCDSILAENPGQRDAALLAAQGLAWSGHVEDAVRRYHHWLDLHTDDGDAWLALAQTWRWAGRAEETKSAIEHALILDPQSDTARSQLEWANAVLSPSLEPTVINTNDSDDSRSTLYVVGGGVATPWGARLLGDARYRVADLNALHGTAASLRAASSWSPLNGRWVIRGELGATQLEASDGPGAATVSHLQPIVGASISGRAGSALSLGAGISHTAFDESAALIGAGIATTAVSTDAAAAISSGLSLGVGSEWTRFNGGSEPNTRIAGSGVLRWSIVPSISMAAGLRGFAYQHAAFDGYFAPKRYALAEVSSRARIGSDLGWGLEGEMGLGDQTITAFDNSSTAHFAQRINVALTYRPATGVEWAVSGGFANVASPTTVSSSDYRIYTITLKGRWRI